MRAFFGFLLLLLCCSTLKAETGGQLWLYCPTNLQVDENIDKLQHLWKRAADAGYTHVLLADSKFSHLDVVQPNYFKNVARIKQIAADLHLQIVPSLFAVGYSNDLLFNDPNLAEGLPVKDSLFVVQGGTGRLVPDPSVAFEKPGYKDDNVSINNGIADMARGKGVSRLIFSLKLPKFRCYHVSVKVRTQDLTSHPEIKVIGGEVTLNWKNLNVQPTQDWTEQNIVFNSLDHDQVGVYFGVWDGVKGTLQWKDWKIEEVGLLNVLRRDGTPCVVKGDGDGKVYVEGKDYQPIADPHMGNVPWNGGYEVWHEPPVIKTGLPDGTRLRVSWYHPAVIYDEQVAACIADPKTMALLADQAKRMKDLWGAPMYMMEHDEFRTAGWDDSCQKTGKTPGQLLADNVRACTGLLKPQRAAVWSDMFDPFHNAVKGPYFLVNGPLTGSWEGLGKDVLVVNWNFGKRDDSLKFFAGRGNPQLIAGYYDADPAQLKDWLASAAKVKGVVGIMYTTWRGDYSKVEEFAKIAKKVQSSE